MTTDWDCEAYGPDGRKVGALCFFAELNERKCSSPEACHGAMALERQRVFQRINDLAAEGDPDAAFLKGEFSSPDQLLGGNG